jgi:hypothetical protein
MSEAPEGMISAKKFAKIIGKEPLEVIEMIREGAYKGRKSNGFWYVSRTELSASESSSLSNPVNSPKSNKITIGTSLESDVIDKLKNYVSGLRLLIIELIQASSFAAVLAFLFASVELGFMAFAFGGVPVMLAKRFVISFVKEIK